jgi:hypothetical protein
MIEHEANGSFITKQLTDYVLQKVREEIAAEKSKAKIDRMEMSKSQWKKIVAMFTDPEDGGMKEGNLEFQSIPVKVTKYIAESEIRFMAKDDTTLGKIVGLER